jgi:hypothetical protein
MKRKGKSFRGDKASCFENMESTAILQDSYFISSAFFLFLARQAGILFYVLNSSRNPSVIARSS